MLNTALYTTFLASVVFLLLTPGTVIALITSTTARQGQFKALKTALGTNCASLVLIAIASLAISGFLSINEFFIYVIGIVGSLYIAYTSLTHLINVFRKTHTDTPYTSRSGFKYGFTIAISNPKDIFFSYHSSLNLLVLLIVYHTKPCYFMCFMDSAGFIHIINIYIVHKISSARTSKALDIISTAYLVSHGLTALKSAF